MDSRIVNTIMCSLEGAYAFQGHFFRPFEGVLNPMHRPMDRAGLKPVRKEVIGLGRGCTP